MENYDETIRKRLSESIAVKTAFLEDADAIGVLETMAKDMVSTLQRGGKIMFAGNGGSFADSIHLTGEFVSRFLLDRAPIAAIALGANNSIITSIGNDYTYEDIFVRELRALGRSGDLFVGISTSGNSPNIVQCMQVAGELGITAYGMTGSKPSRMDEFGTCLKIPSTETPRIQECHIAAGHIFCELVERELYG